MSALPGMQHGGILCPNPNPHTGSSCKKRACEVCGPRWARDQRRNMEINLGAYGGPVALVSITAPGEHRLPWDESACAHKGKPGKPHKHAGKRGCRVQQRAAREWSETASYRWQLLRAAAHQRVRRAMKERYEIKFTPRILERVWEPQRRGVPHMHLVLPMGSAREREAAQLFANAIADLAGEYDFGHVDRGKFNQATGQRELQLISAKDAARYLASYLTGRSKHKPNVRQAIEDPAMIFLLERERVDRKRGRRRYALPMVWITPRLSRVTLCTMRTLRRARHLWAALEGRCEVFPEWESLTEAVKVVALYRRIYNRRDGPHLGDDVLEEALAFAKTVDERAGNQIKAAWRYWAQSEKTRFAFLLTGGVPEGVPC